MTQREFDGLPMVLNAHHLKELLGVSDEGLRSLRAESPELVLRRLGRKFQYSKKMVATLFKLDYK